MIFPNVLHDVKKPLYPFLDLAEYFICVYVLKKIKTNLYIKYIISTINFGILNLFSDTIILCIGVVNISICIQLTASNALKKKIYSNPNL
ncbi:hypothetical protein SAMN02910278_00498 [Peptostreptococcus sp. D1]|nr:hypothetical protein SAMN02910278_00498 [Peptostreptococcus sp. D1]